MPSYKLALVIHGVNTRIEEEYYERVESLMSGLLPKTEDKWLLCPVFWGDLGAQVEDIKHFLPKNAQQSGSIHKWVIGGIWHLISGYAGGSTLAAIKLANALRHSAFGNKKKAEEIFAEIEKTSEAIVDKGYDYWWEAFDYFRIPLTRPILNFVGDVIIYHNAGVRQKIQSRMWDVLKEFAEVEIVSENMGSGLGTKENPVSVIAHSLGGLIAFELALERSNNLWIDHLITMGSQPAFFYRIDPSRYGNLRRTEDGKLILPDSIRRWTNILDPFDVLSFPVKESFILSNGESPVDIVSKESIDPVRHGAYWLQTDLISKILGARGGNP